MFGWQGRFETCPYGLAGGLRRWTGMGVAVVEGRGVWLVCPSPPRALTLTLSRRAGEGMFVADEGVAAVREDLVVWLVWQV